MLIQCSRQDEHYDRGPRSAMLRVDAARISLVARCSDVIAGFRMRFLGLLPRAAPREDPAMASSPQPA